MQISHQHSVLLLYWRVKVGVASFNDLIDQLQTVQTSALAAHALCCLFCFVPDDIWSKQQKALANYTPRFDDHDDDHDGEYCDGDGDDFDDLRGINMAALEGAWCPRHIWPPNIITCWCQLIRSMNIKSFRMAFDSQQGIMGRVVPVNPPSRAIRGQSRTNFQLPVKQNQNVKVQFYRNGLFLLGV